MRRPRRIARGANLRRRLVAEELRPAAQRPRLRLQPFGFAGLGRQEDRRPAGEAPRPAPRDGADPLSAASSATVSPSQRFRIAAPWRERRESLFEFPRRCVDLVAGGAQPAGGIVAPRLHETRLQ